MSSRASRPCSTPGCINLTGHGAYCEGCRRAGQRGERKAKDPRAVAFYHSAAWLRFRLSILAKRPLCEMDCQEQGRTTAGTDVDHVEPIATPAGWARRLDPTNMRVGCHPCHSRRTARDQSGWGRHVVGGGDSISGDVGSGTAGAAGKSRVRVQDSPPTRTEGAA